MAIDVTVCYVATCDICKEDFEDDYLPHFHSVTEAREHIETYDGAVFGDHVWCQDCIPPCSCGHLFGEHNHGDAPCEDCACEGYVPVPERSAA